ncbi:hypothetical protein BP5796_06134 [Coleophoma crateriformis]|uniref:Uncharacterized protein n=1 Tax=Coleophoma crateriformis TaxID=565419 RepID=A0A3D8RW35_9HELO|nr:hypothetical protein BP5796_06134 [Coleophoma crateriformis]
MKITAALSVSIFAVYGSLAAARIPSAIGDHSAIHLDPIKIIPEPNGVVSIEQPVPTAHLAMPLRKMTITVIKKHEYRRLHMAQCCRDPACACIQFGQKELDHRFFDCTDVEDAFKANATICQLEAVEDHSVYNTKSINATVSGYEERVNNNAAFLHKVLEHSGFVSLLHNRTGPVHHGHHFAWNIANAFASHFRHHHQNAHNGTFNWSVKLHSGVPVHHNTSALPHPELIKLVWNTMKATAANVNGTSHHEDGKLTQLKNIIHKNFISPGGVFEDEMARLATMAPTWVTDDKPKALNLTHIFSPSEVDILQEATTDAVGITALQLAF